jgi:alpha-ribazole phosphatase
MEIYLVRHTTPDIDKGVCYGQSDIGVVGSFFEESKIIEAKIPESTDRLVFSSPLKRCVKLAAKFSENFKEDSRLMELNFGDWELKKWNDIPKEEITPWMTDFVNVAVPNGESYLDLNSRVLEFYNEVLQINCEQIIIVTHGGAIRSLLANLTNVTLKDSFDIKVEYGQTSRVSISEITNVEVSI